MDHIKFKSLISQILMCSEYTKGQKWSMLHLSYIRSTCNKERPMTSTKSDKNTSDYQLKYKSS